MGRQHGAADLESLAIDEDAMAVDNVDMRMCDEVIRDIGKCAGKQHVVAVEIGHDLALDAGEAEIDGAGLPLVRYAAPAQAIASALQEIERAVDRGAVLHVIIQVRIVLADDAVDRGAEILHMVVARRDHRDSWRARMDRRCWQESRQVEQARRILLEGPHRRAAPEAPKRGTSLPGGNKILVPLQERDAVLELFETLPELLIHHRYSRKLQRKCSMGRSDRSPVDGAGSAVPSSGIVPTGRADSRGGCGSIANRYSSVPIRVACRM